MEKEKRLAGNKPR